MDCDTTHIYRPLGGEYRELIHKLINSEGRYTISVPLIDHIISLSDSLVLRNGEALIEYGVKNADFYVLLKGILRRFYWNNKVEVTDAFAEEGTQVLDYNSYYYDGGCLYTIEACTPCLLLHLSRSHYDELLATSREFEHWRLMMAYNTLWLNDWSKTEYPGDAKSRYKALMTNRPTILHNVPLKVIASYLGMSPNYLSNLRNEIFREEKEAKGLAPYDHSLRSAQDDNPGEE